MQTPYLPDWTFMMQKRDQLILQYVNQKGKVSVVELSEMLSVAVETIRRDLTALENKGLLHRIHGAAVTCRKTMPMPKKPSHKMPLNIFLRVRLSD